MADPEGFAIVAKTFGFLSFLGQFYDFTAFDWVFWDSTMISLGFDSGGLTLALSSEL